MTGHATDSLRILLVEDDPADAELEERQLRENGLAFAVRCVLSRESFLAALREFDPHLILTDYKLPGFDGMEALALARERAPQTPVVVVTGSINEETAVECMKAGATDYVLKGHLARLAPAVRSALERRRILEDKSRAEDALRASERKHRAMFEEARDGIFIADADTRVLLEANPSALELMGLPAGRIGAVSLADLVAREDADQARRAWDRAARGEAVGPTEVEIVRSDASRVPVEIHASRFVGGDGRACLVGVARDISERRRADEERVLLGAALEQAAELAIITDTAGTIQYVNPAFERVTGYSRQEAIGHNPRLLKSGMQSADVYRRLWDTLAAGGVFTGTFVNRKKNGETYVAEVLISPVRDSGGRVTHYVGLQRDVTREQDLEEQLRQAQKMEAIGLLAGGIAHDFNNLLSVILTNARLVKEDLPAASPSQGCLTDLLDATNQGSAMVRKLLAFSRRERLSPIPVRVAAALGDLARTLRRLLPESITVRLEPAPADPLVLADSGALEQILLNLATNARDAMPQGGTLSLNVSEVGLRDDDAATLGIDRPGRYACVAVTDSGQGMDEATAARAFEPFFTTKAAGAGTGLGLAMVFVVMQQHHGFVHLYSEPGRGTTVRLYFPALPGQSDALGAAPPPLPPGNETVLVVEDQEVLRRTAARALTKLGYQVLVAHDGEEALRVLAEQGDRIDLVLSDLVMPKLSGIDLIGRIRAAGNRVPCLLMSGYPAGAQGAAPIPPDVKLLEKPWTMEQLATGVRTALDQS